MGFYKFGLAPGKRCVSYNYLHPNSHYCIIFVIINLKIHVLRVPLQISIYFENMWPSESNLIYLFVIIPLSHQNVFTCISNLRFQDVLQAYVHIAEF